jgi:hypothetical protein
MKTTNFINLINEITGREFFINTTDENLQTETEYYIYKILPITGRKIGFYWVTPKTMDKFLRSFITAFTSKYKEPNPAAYNQKWYNSTWNDKTETDKENAYMHHTSNMFSKTALLEQIEVNFNKDSITSTLCKYGFYTTEYGIGIFCYFNTDGVVNSIAKMTKYLQNKNIPFKNEFSDARWVFRFVLNLDKPKHEILLNSFN